MEHNSELVRKIQLKELEILKVFQDICKRHGLRYFAIGGTCLGAVRHKGFIPWDDDVDVAMPYEDYVKFLEISNKELSGQYGIMNPHTSVHCFFALFSKMHDKTTSFIWSGYEEHYTDTYKGVFIDIFPVQGLPYSNFSRRFLPFLSLLYQRLDTKLRHSFKDMSSTKAKLLWLTISSLKFILPHNFFVAKYEYLMMKYPFNCSYKILFPWRKNMPHMNGIYRNIFPYEHFRDTIELPFEDTTISVPHCYEEYLTMDFGDYMKLPPEDKRNPGHSPSSIVDLERPYTYYMKAGKPLC